MTRVVAGIDPGLTGAIALIVDGDLFDIADMPTVDRKVSSALLRVWLDDLAPHRPHVAAIEDVHSMPRDGGRQAFTFGRSVGVVEGFMGAAGIPTRHVTPQTWKRHHRLIGQDKDAARLRAIERWPHRADWFKRKKDGGRADAALIAQWAWEVLG